MARVWYMVDEDNGGWKEWPSGEAPTRSSIFNVHFLRQFTAWSRYLGTINGDAGLPEFLEVGDDLQEITNWGSNGFYRLHYGDWGDVFGFTGWAYTGSLDFSTLGTITRPSGGGPLYRSYDYPAISSAWEVASVNATVGMNLQDHAYKKLQALRTIMDNCKVCSSSLQPWSLSGSTMRTSYLNGVLQTQTESDFEYGVSITKYLGVGSQYIKSVKLSSLSGDGYDAAFSVGLVSDGTSSPTISGLLTVNDVDKVGIIGYSNGGNPLPDYYPPIQLYSEATSLWSHGIWIFATAHDELPEDFKPVDGFPWEA